MAEQAVDAWRDLVALGIPFAGDGERLAQRHLSGNTYPRSIFVPEGTGRVVMEHLAAHAERIGVAAWPGIISLLCCRTAADVVGALLWDRRAQQFIGDHAHARS